MDQNGDICRCDCHITYLDNTKPDKCYCRCNTGRKDMDHTKIFEHINGRLDKLEKHFSGDYQLVASKKTPHKCPVCVGLGRCLTESAKADFDAVVICAGLPGCKECQSCKGTGIVWG